MRVGYVCMCVYGTECMNALIALTQAFKISLHLGAPWFSRIQNACNTEKLTMSTYSHTTLLHPHVPV